MANIGAFEIETLELITACPMLYALTASSAGPHLSARNITLTSSTRVPSIASASSVIGCIMNNPDCLQCGKPICPVAGGGYLYCNRKRNHEGKCSFTSMVFPPMASGDRNYQAKAEKFLAGRLLTGDMLVVDLLIEFAQWLEELDKLEHMARQ